MKREALKLRTRIGIHFLGLVGTWTLFVLLLLGNLIGRKSQELFREQGAQLARALALECAPLVQYEELGNLRALLSERLRPPSDVRYILVERSDGEVVAHTFDHGIPADLATVEHPTQALPDVGVQLIDTERERLFDYRASGPGIVVRMGMSLTSVQLFAHEVTMYILWIGLAAFLGVLAVTLHVSRPVEALATAIATRSDVKLQAPFDGTFETQALAGWLEHMNERLDESGRRLDQSKKLAYLGEVAASIAHEVNNPLGIIVLNSGFLAKRVAKGELSGKAAEEVERIRAAATRATFAAQQLLQVARYSTRSTEMRKRPVRPQQLVNETVDLLRDRIRVSGCVVKVEVAPDLPSVTLDQQGVQQVLFNLLTNALDATPAGNAIVIAADVTEAELAPPTAAAGSDEEPSEAPAPKGERRLCFQLSVTDQGKGMGQDLLDQAKEPFVTTKEAGKGTGLGLAISDSIVRGHGGTLVLSSQPGAGTTATVHLPLEQA